MISLATDPLVFLALSIAGGLGAASRFALDQAITTAFARRAKAAPTSRPTHALTPGTTGQQKKSPTLPWGTIIVNLSGSLVLGLITGFVTAGIWPPEVQLVVGVGFLGGYTTFSAASFQTVQLLREGWTGAGLLAGAGQLVGGILLAGVGLAVGFVARLFL